VAVLGRSAPKCPPEFRLGMHLLLRYPTRSIPVRLWCSTYPSQAVACQLWSTVSPEASWQVCATANGIPVGTPYSGVLKRGMGRLLRQVSTCAVWKPGDSRAR
jgi:hypothetical protein